MEYEGLLNIPQSEAIDAEGHKWEIRHMVNPAGKPMRVASFRTAMYGGHDTKEVVWDHDTIWHELLENGGRWTSDLPIEQFQQWNAIKGFKGKVLVGGLGLGVVVQMLMKKRGVKQVDVVEKSKTVIDLVGPYVGDRKRTWFIEEDLFEFLRAQTRKDDFYDCGFFDIWSDDSEGTFYNVVLPLRQLAKHRVGKLYCWNEDIMRGQIHQGLTTRLMTAMSPLTEEVPPEKRGWNSFEELATEIPDHTWHNRLVPFYKTIAEHKPSPASPKQWRLVMQAASLWAKTYDGDPNWPTRWAELMRLWWR